MSYFGNKRPYEVFGSGRLTAPLHKSGDEQSGWTYRFEICEMDPEDGAVPPLLKPEDLPDLQRILRLLAFTISDDGCVSPELREELSGMAGGGDDVSGSDGQPGGWPTRPCSPAAEALRHVVDYLWEDEARDFRATPSNGHIYRYLVVLDRWLEGCGPSEGHQVADIDREVNGDDYGVCPICGCHDGYLNLGRARWYVCHAHRLRWCPGEHVPPSCPEQTPKQLRANWRQIGGYREIVPLHVPALQSQTEPEGNRTVPHPSRSDSVESPEETASTEP